MVRVTVYRIFRGSMPFISAWPPATDKPGTAVILRARNLSPRERDICGSTFSIDTILTRERVCFIRNDDVCFGGGKKRIDDE